MVKNNKNHKSNNQTIRIRWDGFHFVLQLLSSAATVATVIFLATEYLNTREVFFLKYDIVELKNEKILLQDEIIRVSAVRMKFQKEIERLNVFLKENQREIDFIQKEFQKVRYEKNTLEYKYLVLTQRVLKLSLALMNSISSEDSALKKTEPETEKIQKMSTPEIQKIKTGPPRYE